MNLAFNAAASGQLDHRRLHRAERRRRDCPNHRFFPPRKRGRCSCRSPRISRGVVGQVLVPKMLGRPCRRARADAEHRAPCPVRHLAQARSEHLGAAIAAGRQQGMCTLGDALLDLVAEPRGLAGRRPSPGARIRGPSSTSWEAARHRRRSSSRSTEAPDRLGSSRERS